MARDPKASGPTRGPAGRVRIGKAYIHGVGWAEAEKAVERLIARGRLAFIVFANVDQIVLLERSPLMKEIYDRAALVLADGWPLLWAARLLKTRLKARIPGPDLVPRIAVLCARMKAPLFLLGAGPGVALRAARRMKQGHPDLEIAGTLAPPAGFDEMGQEGRRAADAVRTARTKVLFIAFGSPKQERWMARHGKYLGDVVVVAVGAAFDFIARHKRRSPACIGRLGLEWLWRLLHEPRRLWKRYLLRDPAFLGLVWQQVCETRREEAERRPQERLNGSGRLRG